MEEIDLKDYIAIIIKHKIMIIAITIAAALASFVISKFILTPMYSATATLIVGNTKVDVKQDVNINDLMVYDKLVSTYAKVLKSRNILEDTTSKLSFKAKAENIDGLISITPQQDTQLIDVEVKNKNPHKAAEIANKLVSTFTSKVSQIMSMEQNVNALDKAKVPDAPVSPKVSLNVAIAFFIGLILSMFIAFILEYLDNTIKTPDDIEKHLGLPLIGTIPFVTEEMVLKGGNRRK